MIQLVSDHNKNFEITSTGKSTGSRKEGDVRKEIKKFQVLNAVVESSMRCQQ
jgi:hypothetical protein